MYPKTTRRNQIILFVLIILTITLLTFQYRGGEKSFLEPFKEVALRISSSFQAASAKVFSPVSQGFRFLKDLGALRRENLKLRKEVANLEQKVISLKEQAKENKRLKKLVRFKDKTSLETMPARVIGRAASGWQATIVVDKGFVEGVEEKMPAVSGEGLVGQVIAVFPHASEIELILDQKSGVGGEIQESGEDGLVEGELGKNLKLNLINKDTSVKKGETVITSGLGGVYPRGILIGYVSKVSQKPYSLYKEIRVRPAVNFSRLEEVLIVTEPEPALPSSFSK